ncbi:MAG: hypothetical protein HYX54_04765 [Chloroflexi bacterium]|nr:hypothetical protein [Chloroflexota bacterium]
MTADSVEPMIEGGPRLVRLGTGAIRVELLPELGARLHRLKVFGHDLLRTPSDPRVHIGEPFAWGGYVMAPWCNRIDPVPTAVGESIVSVPANTPDGTALHGQVYLAPWQERGPGFYAVRGGGAGTGWPWPYETTLRVTAAVSGIDRATLTVGQVLTNLADGPMPGGVGLHPWFQGPLEIRIAADLVLPSNVDSARSIEDVSGAFDLRSMGGMPSDLDATWLDPGHPPVELRWPNLGIQAVMEVTSDAGLCIVAASPVDAGAVAVEPETHAPQGLRRLLAGDPYGLTWLRPGRSITLITRIDFERAR